MLEHAQYVNDFEERGVVMHSSSICCIAYDEDFKELTVHFHGGPTLYTYINVPYYVVRDLLLAPSAGTYFHRRIKDRYVWTKEAWL